MRWNIKRGGHTYKLTAQTWASIFRRCSMWGVVIGIGMSFRFSDCNGDLAALLCAIVSVVSWAWRGGLREVNGLDRKLAVPIRPTHEAV